MGELLVAHRALAAVDPGDVRQARAALRAALCARREDLDAFDEAWDAWLDQARPAPLDDPAVHMTLPHVDVPGSGDPGDARGGDLVPRPAAYSEVELLRVRDFAVMTDAERAAARRLLTRLARRGPAPRPPRGGAPPRRRRPAPPPPPRP